MDQTEPIEVAEASAQPTKMLTRSKRQRASDRGGVSRGGVEPPPLVLGRVYLEKVESG